MRPNALFSGKSLPEYEQAISEAGAVVADAVASANHPATPRPPAHLRSDVRQVDLDRPLGELSSALEESRDLFLEHAVWFHDARYQAHLNCPVATAAIAADVIASSVNTSVDTWDQSLAATHIETHLLEWLAGRLGLGDLADGVFTSGGTASNLQALLLAREHSTADGTPLDALRILTSPEAHFSVTKAARTLGLAADAVVHCPTDERGRLRPDGVESAIDDAEKAGLTVMAVSATAGTTDRGAVDPLAALAQITHGRGLWLHVDAAVGGALVTSSRHSSLLDGIGGADSVTVDFHKTWYQPVAASALLVRDRRMFAHSRTNADYLNPEHARVPNLVDKSLATSRRFDALKPWITLRTHGADAIGSWLDASLDLAQEAHTIAEAMPDLEVFERPSTHMLLFRFTAVDLEQRDDVNDAIRETLFMEGRTVIARTRWGGETWLKLTLLNPMADAADLRATFDDVVRTGHLLAGDLSAEVSA